MIGTKIYDFQGDLQELFKEWLSLNFDTIFVSRSLYSNHKFRKLVQNNKMNAFIIFPVFYDPKTLENNPELYSITDKGEKAIDEWIKFVCPSRDDYRRYKIEEIKKEVMTLNPDGLSLDFIRYFVFWEKIYPGRTMDSIPNCCFCSHCIEKFQKDTQVSLPKEITDNQKKAEIIQNNLSNEWTKWKCNIIFSFIKEITEEVKKLKPEILINVHVIPWRKEDFNGAIEKIAGQNLKEIAKIVDMISPMCYSHMLKRQPSWINSVVKDMYEQTKHKIIPSIQVEKCYLKTEISTEEFSDMITEALKDPSSGIVFWSWEKIQGNIEKKQLLKTKI
ncbi:MAG: putative glycoside hydrolase [Promethearchaeota archaeon]